MLLARSASARPSAAVRPAAARRASAGAATRPKLRPLAGAAAGNARAQETALNAAVEAESGLAELEAIEAAVEALRLENERLKAQVGGAVSGPHAVVPAPEPRGSAVSSSWGDFSYPKVEGDGFGICQYDRKLWDYKDHLSYRWSQYKKMRENIDRFEGGLEKFSRGYEKLGFTRSVNGITYREWAPGAEAASLIGDFNGWDATHTLLAKNEFGVFEVNLPNNADGSPAIPHGSRVKVHLKTAAGEWIDRIPAWIKFAVQAPNEIPFNGIYYDPPPEEAYTFKHPRPAKPKALRIYECHVGMSSPEPKVSTYNEFKDAVLPRVKALGYNAIQIMAIQEHAYYASFGYHVTNFFAISSRCGTPEELKAMIDRAHELGLYVLMDCVHSHASSNTNDGLNMFDGSDAHYFHSGARGYHWMWDSRLFNYGHWEVLRFLLSNLRFYLEEYKFDGFRFDGVTSMMYQHHGLQMTFTGDYGQYFGPQTDVECLTFLMLANDMVHTLYPGAITIAEDVSGMPGLCHRVAEGGVGFDYRLQMAVADKWIEVMKKWTRDEDWDMGNLVFTMENRRYDERCIAYAESHDQALVGDKTLAFWLMDKEMYDNMSTLTPYTPVTSRGIALHKMIRALTMTLGGNGYLNFMGNEFGHPEWIDFPRGDFWTPQGKFIPGNGNSYHHARRRYDLADMAHLRYAHLGAFDAALNAFEEKHSIMASGHQFVSRKDNTDKLIVYERGDCVFVFNFHPSQSYTNYRVGCHKPGKFEVVLSSDMPEFGGFSNVKTGGEYFAQGGHDGRPHSLQVYAPSRTVTVYAPIEFRDPLAAYCEASPDADECRMHEN